MTDQAVDPKIVARIKKLMNLSKDGAATENEQEIAAAHAQRLMMEHNVSIATVEAAQDHSRVIRRTKEKHAGHAMYEWQKDLMASVATANFVKVTTTVMTGAGSYGKGEHRIKGYVLVGREENVVGARIMFDYLRSTIERLAREYAGGNAYSLSNAAMSFKKGCGNRVGTRLLERHRVALAEQRAKAEEARAVSGGNALVVFMDDYEEAERCANEDFRLGLEPGTTARNKYVWKVQSQAWNAATVALDTPEFALVDDLATLNQKADEIVESVLASVSMSDAERATVRSYARLAAVYHSDTVKDAKSGKKHPKARVRSWGRVAPKSNTNYAAFRAGSEAGNGIGLDKQAAHQPNKKLG